MTVAAVVVVACCRAGFEAEAAEDLRRLARACGMPADVDALPLRGFVAATLSAFDAGAFAREAARAPPVFARSLFVGRGPLPVASAGRNGRIDRVTPLVDALAACAPSAAREIWLEFPDTNEGKSLSTLARALAPRIEAALRERGALDAASRTRLHAFLVDKDNAYVGVSDDAFGARWPMGIPRLRMPHGAPSRSTAKLAEAIVVFLGDRERKLLRPGLRAVDLGAAPGGWTWQLAHRELKVIAVDNGPLKGDVAIDPRVTHIRADGLSWRPRSPVDWLVCDIVLQPVRIAALVADWIADGLAERAIFNLKLPMKKRYAEVERCAALIDERLRSARVRHALRLRQLYHDREEVTGFVERLR